MRNATGLRNCTLQGLTGTLGSANSYGTKRPSAGAFVSLDPGYGPQDYKTWIATPTAGTCLLYTSPSPRDVEESRMPSSA